MKTHCSHAGCTNQVLEGGVCWTHGAKRELKGCSLEGCAMESLKVDFVLLMVLWRYENLAQLWGMWSTSHIKEEFVAHMVQLRRKSCSFEGIPARVLITTRLYRRLYSLVVTCILAKVMWTRVHFYFLLTSTLTVPIKQRMEEFAGARKKRCNSWWMSKPSQERRSLYLTHT
jgi:hypothetical protein